MNVGFMFSMEIGKTNSFANLLLSSFQPVKTLQTKSVFQHFFATRGHSGRWLEKRKKEIQELGFISNTKRDYILILYNPSFFAPSFS